MYSNFAIEKQPIIVKLVVFPGQGFFTTPLQLLCLSDNGGFAEFIKKICSNLLTGKLNSA